MINPSILSRNFNQFPMTLYHGTTSINYDSLSNGVQLEKCMNKTDFGQGFYLTSNFTQASKHALNRKRENEEAIVFVYKLDIERLKKCFNGKVWNKMDGGWAQFIYDNRTSLKQFNHQYDFVFGGVADGKIFDLVQLVDAGATIKLFHEEIAKYPTYDQLSVHNEDIFTYNVIKFEKVVVAHDKQKEYVKGRVIK